MLLASESAAVKRTCTLAFAEICVASVLVHSRWITKSNPQLLTLLVW